MPLRKERNVVPGTLRSAVEAEVEKLLPHGKAKAENVAEALGLSLRTLARRLADEGTTYGEVVDQLRKSLANQISTIRGCRSGRSRGCSDTKVRPRSITLSSVGQDGRLPLIGTGERRRALGGKRQSFGRL